MKFLKKPWDSITFKSILNMIVLLSVFSVIVGLIGYSAITSSLLKLYSDSAFRTASHASRQLDANSMDYYEDSAGMSPAYNGIISRLNQICNNTDSTFIYVIRPDTSDYKHIKFIFSVMNKDMDYHLYDFGYVRETTNSEYEKAYKALYEEGSEQELVVRDKGFIETDSHITAMVPLVDDEGVTQGILCVQRQLDILTETRNDHLRDVILLLIIVVIVAGIFQSSYLHRVFLNPVRLITIEASRFAQENTPAASKLKDNIKGYDEIGVLAESIDTMEEQICSYVENLESITAERERISTELGLAKRIQEDMLPRQFPAFPGRTEFDIFAAMDPAREVGGDFYDFFLIDEDHLYMTIADVSGKGIPAALFMMISKTILANNAMMKKSPARILADTNTALCASNIEEMFVTVWLGILELSTGHLVAANAGHEYPMILSPGGKYELYKDRHGFVIGGMEGMQYREYELDMTPGTRLFVYTDGIPEATRKDKEMFGIERTLKALNRTPDVSASETLAAVKHAVDDFVMDAEQFDDMTMLCFEYRG